MFFRGILLVAAMMFGLPAMAADQAAVPGDSSGPMVSGEFADHTMEDIELTMKVVRAYQDLLDGNQDKAMRGFRDAALQGHAGAAETLLELTWAIAPENERFTETKHWVEVAQANGASLGELPDLLNQRDVAAIDQYFEEKLREDTPPDYVAEESDVQPIQWRKNSWVDQRQPKDTTLEVKSNVYGLVMIDGIIAGSVNEELEVEPGSRTVELLVANKPAHRVSVQAVKGRMNRVNLTGYKFKKYSH